MKYPVKIVADATARGAVAESLITCRDLPIMTSSGTTPEDCLQNAKEGIEATITVMLEEKQYIPQPSAIEPGEVMVEIDPAFARLITFNNLRATHTAGTSVLNGRTKTMLAEHDTPENAGKVVIVVSDKDAIPGNQ